MNTSSDTAFRLEALQSLLAGGGAPKSVHEEISATAFIAMSDDSRRCICCASIYLGGVTKESPPKDILQFPYIKAICEVAWNDFSGRLKEVAVQVRRCEEMQCYDVLESTPTDSNMQIQGKYRSLIKRFHPDKHCRSSAKLQAHALSMTKDLNAAYEMIKMKRGAGFK